MISSKMWYVEFVSRDMLSRLLISEQMKATIEHERLFPGLDHSLDAGVRFF